MATELAREAPFVQSLERGLTVIGALSAPGPGLTVSEVARATSLTRAAARRFLLTLEQLGYVRSDGRAFALTPRILELGYAYLSALSLPEIAQPHLEALAERVGESCSISVLDGDEIVYVARVPVGRIMAVTISVGTRFPAATTAMGRVLLAGRGGDAGELAGIVAQGWAVVDSELEEGLRSVAAPIHRDGEVVAAVNVATHASRTTLDEVHERLLPALLDAAAAIEGDLRAQEPPSA